MGKPGLLHSHALDCSNAWKPILGSLDLSYNGNMAIETKNNTIDLEISVIYTCDLDVLGQFLSL